MAQLNFSVLGTPEIHYRGQLLKFPTRKAQALLIYLVVERGVHDRADLSALFWPESSSANGRAALRVTLAQVRELVVENPDELPYLNIEHDSLGFNFASDFTCDVHVLLESYRELRNTDDMPAETQRSLLDQFHNTLKLYRGDFLEDFSLSDAPEFDDWASAQREACQRSIDAIFEWTVDLHLSRNEPSRALDLAERWVSLSGINEVAYQRLIQAHFMNGDRVRALQAYEAACDILQRELRVAPSPEITALAERIRISTPQRRTSGRTSQRPPSAPMLLESAMVGRTDEFGKLIEIYTTACERRTQAVVLQGEAGAGKTRLADEFVRWALMQGANVVEGRAFETESSLSYQPLVDAFRKCIAAVNAPEDLLSDVWLAELSRLLPELRERYPDLPPPTQDEATAHTRLLEAIANLGLALAERAPLLLFIDDIQWADSASLDVLHYAVRRWRASEAPIMLLLNLRSESLNVLSTLANWLADLGRIVSVVRLILNPLKMDDILQLVRALSADVDGAEASTKAKPPASDSLEQFSRWLFAETNGQPFYIIETLKALLEQGTLSLKPDPNGRWLFDFTLTRDKTALQSVIPTGVREVIRRRLNYLRPEAMTLIAAGAVLGQHFHFDQLCRVAALDENNGLSALEQTLTNRLLRESVAHVDNSADSAYDFVHDKIREIVYDEMSEARRHIFHRRAFEILECHQAAPAILAYHALAAALKEPAFRYSILAGDEAMRLFAVGDAILHYEQAHRLHGEPAKIQGETEDLHHLYAQLGRAYELNNRFDQARSIYEEMLAFAREANLISTMVVALNRLATLAAQLSSDFQTAISLLQEALQLAALGDDKTLLAETEWSLSQVDFHAWLPYEGLVHADRALALARQIQNIDLVARSLNILAILTIVVGQWTRAKTCAAEAASLYAGMGNKALQADSLSHLANAYFLRAEFEEALQIAYQMQQINLEIQNVWTGVLSHFTLAATYRDTGFYEQALAHARDASTLARVSNVPILMFLSGLVLGTVYRALQFLEEARAAHLKALEVASQMAPRYSEVIAAELCADYALAGDWETASHYALQALSLRDYTFAPGAGLPLPYETAALLRAGKHPEALKDLTEFESHMGEGKRLQVSYLRSLAILSHWKNNFEQEVAYLEEAALVAEQIGLVEEQWLIRAALGEAYSLRQDQRGSELSFGRAFEVIQIGAARIADRQLRDHFLQSGLIVQITERKES